MDFSRHFILKRDQILVLIGKDFKLKYDSTCLGFLWSMLIPLLMSGVYFIVFGMMMRWGSVENYLLYLVSGNFLWSFFASAVNQNGTVMLRNTALLKKTNFDRRLLVWATFFTEGTHFLLTIPVLAGIMASFGVMPNGWMLLNVVLALGSMMLLAVGMGYLYAAINIVFRDLEKIFQIIMMMWLYCSPVFIPITRVPEKFLPYYMLNPMSQILMLWRDSFWCPGFHPDRLMVMLPTCVVIFLFGRWVFRKVEPCFAELM